MLIIIKNNYLFADSEVSSVHKKEIAQLRENFFKECLQGRKVVEGHGEHGEKVVVGQEEESRRIASQRPESGREQTLCFLSFSNENLLKINNYFVSSNWKCFK